MHAQNTQRCAVQMHDPKPPPLAYLSHHIFKTEPSHPAEKSNFRSVYSHFHNFHHYPQLK